MTTIHKGKIIGLRVINGSGIALLEIDDERRGRVDIPCDNAATVRSLENVFGGVIVEDHTFDQDAIAGKEIFYGTNYLGILVGFSPADEADPEIVADYEAAGKKAGNTVVGYLPPDDRIFTGGPIVSGRRPLGRDN